MNSSLFLFFYTSAKLRLSTRWRNFVKKPRLQSTRPMLGLNKQRKTEPRCCICRTLFGYRGSRTSLSSTVLTPNVELLSRKQEDATTAAAVGAYSVITAQASRHQFQHFDTISRCEFVTHVLLCWRTCSVMNQWKASRDTNRWTVTICNEWIALLNSLQPISALCCLQLVQSGRLWRQYNCLTTSDEWILKTQLLVYWLKVTNQCYARFMIRNTFTKRYNAKGSLFSSYFKGRLALRF